MTRAEIQTELAARYAHKAYFLNANCGLGSAAGGSSADTFVPITDAQRIANLLERDVACLGSWDRPLVVMFFFDTDRANAIEVTYVRMESV